MKITIPNIEFTSFNDGICNIYSEDEEGNRIDKYVHLGFEKRTLGYNRYFAAAANNIKASIVIRIPNVREINAHDIVTIPRFGKFDIELVQSIKTTNPESIDLTLSQIEIFKGDINEQY